MHIYMNRFTYDYDNDGKVKDAKIGLYGNDDDQLINCTLLIKPEDLEGKTFDDVTLDQTFNLAKKKALAYLQPADTKTASDGGGDQ